MTIGLNSAASCWEGPETVHRIRKKHPRKSNAQPAQQTEQAVCNPCTCPCALCRPARSNRIVHQIRSSMSMGRVAASCLGRHVGCACGAGERNDVDQRDGSSCRYPPQRWQSWVPERRAPVQQWGRTHPPHQPLERQPGSSSTTAVRQHTKQATPSYPIPLPRCVQALCCHDCIATLLANRALATHLKLSGGVGISADMQVTMTASFFMQAARHASQHAG